MTIKDKLKRAGAVGLATLVGYMPLHAQGNIEDINYSFYPHALLNKPQGELSFDYNGKRYVLIDIDRDNRPDILETDDSQFTGDLVEQKYGNTYREEKRAFIQRNVNTLKNILRNGEGKVKVKKSKLLLNEFPSIEVEVKGNDGRRYTAIDSDADGNTESFYVSAEGKSDSYTLFLDNDNSPDTKELIGDLVVFAVKNNMPKF